MIDSVLVANRGEIACRIFRTARRLGIRTIAVYSDADAGARHVREADEAVRIGPPAPRESYLDIARILEAARASGASAIHPGYGFLSENARFAQACVEAGRIFVGPPAAAIAAMGSKIVAKARMRAAGVPVLPGYEGTEQDLDHLLGQARRLGVPLIIKPAAGGGGKGMRIVREEGQLPEALAAGRRLAESGFGDGALLLERFLAAPRHIEVQIFADGHGNFVHLGDRDCSTQRRHQKLIEEAPAPALPDDLRERLRAAALVVAREIGYVSAGTVEFLFDGREFYFMEMNTRLQVEHTVTEAITGLDLVEWQIRVAGGERLPLQQEQIRLHGHAIEARVCAEDPDRDFLPSAGRLRLMEWPTEEAVRVDAGFSSGDAVPESYDSLLGKVIAWSPAREQAAARLTGALRRTYAAGVRTNERWLARVLESAAFLQVRHSIAFLQEHAPEFADPVEVPPVAAALAALVVHNNVQCAAVPEARPGHSPGRQPGGNPWSHLDGFAPNLEAAVALTLNSRGREIPVRIAFSRGIPTAVTVNGPGGTPGAPLPIEQLSLSTQTVAAAVSGRRLQARYLASGTQAHLWLATEHYEFGVQDPRTLEFTATASRGGLTTPLPGVVVAVSVKAGQQVQAGEVLMVLEAMKMEHTITAPQAGTVQVVHFALGERVPEGSELLEITPGIKKS
ncbi:MAG TPA: biotin carboxylase N-terminal domain-containing protein [Steroidobacteraceae bacterium]|nr:biotin carboxylase N-terminal domain-containing protein [Steroidobacteraceae bacterium]